MEFLRFGSSIPGAYWGCCAADIIQDFKQDPDQKASIQLVAGDSGTPLMSAGGTLFLGKTWGEIFKQRMRIGTFGSRLMPNHAFFAVLTADQISTTIGSKWLKLLKEEGFEFLRAIDNSVYTGEKLANGSTAYPHVNYVFALFRNIGRGQITNPFEPPKDWTDLEQVVPEAYQSCVSDGESISVAQNEYQTARWDTSPVVTYTEEELEAAGVPVWYAGARSQLPQQKKADRQAALSKTPDAINVPEPNPWASEDEDEDEMV